MTGLKGALNRQVRARIVKSRFGYYAHITHGVGKLDGCLFAFTSQGIDRKVRRIARRLAESDAAHAAASEVTF